jgi:hypothetical protein
MDYAPILARRLDFGLLGDSRRGAAGPRVD